VILRSEIPVLVGTVQVRSSNPGRSSAAVFELFSEENCRTGRIDTVCLSKKLRLACAESPLHLHDPTPPLAANAGLYTSHRAPPRSHKRFSRITGQCLIL
jgi:hypothetical protein